MPEAIAHMRRGIGIAAETSGAETVEMELQLVLASTLTQTAGYGSTESDAASRRARAYQQRSRACAPP